MKTILCVIGIIFGLFIIIGISGISINNTFKDKISHIQMLRETLNETTEVKLIDNSPQALRMFERENNNKKDIIYALNLQIAQYNSMANRFPYSLFRANYPIAIEKYFNSKE